MLLDLFSHGSKYEVTYPGGRPVRLLGQQRFIYKNDPGNIPDYLYNNLI